MPVYTFGMCKYHTIEKPYLTLFDNAHTNLVMALSRKKHLLGANIQTYNNNWSVGTIFFSFQR